MGSDGQNDPLPLVQAKMLRQLAERLERGDPPLPTDAFNPLADELELRIDEQAVAEAWREQGDDEPDAWKAVKVALGI
jgi:hypothetical protein